MTMLKWSLIFIAGFLLAWYLKPKYDDYIIRFPYPLKAEISCMGIRDGSVFIKEGDVILFEKVLR